MQKSFIKAAEEESWEDFYGLTRLAAADWLEEIGFPCRSSAVRKLQPSFIIDVPEHANHIHVSTSGNSLINYDKVFLTLRDKEVYVIDSSVVSVTYLEVNTEDHCQVLISEQSLGSAVGYRQWIITKDICQRRCVSRFTNLVSISK